MRPGAFFGRLISSTGLHCNHSDLYSFIWPLLSHNFVFTLEWNLVEKKIGQQWHIITWSLSGHIFKPYTSIFTQEWILGRWPALVSDTRGGLCSWSWARLERKMDFSCAETQWWWTFKGHAGFKLVKQLLSVGLSNGSRFYWKTASSQSSEQLVTVFELSVHHVQLHAIASKCS